MNYEQQPVVSAKQYLRMMTWMLDESADEIMSTDIVANLLQALENCSQNQYLSVCETLEVGCKTAILKDVGDDFHRQLRRLSILFRMIAKLSFAICDSKNLDTYQSKLMANSGFVRDIIHVCLKVVADTCANPMVDPTSIHVAGPIIYHLQELISVLKEGVLITLQWHKHLDKTLSKKHIMSCENTGELKPSSLDYQTMQWVLSIIGT
jgi:hypothetical protein